MDALDSQPLPLLALAALALLAMAVVLTIAYMRAARARRRARRRVVEKPNSHYTSQLARDSVAKHRWHGIALDRVHEVNRAEVLRLLATAEAAGVDALRPNERAFLDQIARIAPGPPPPPELMLPEDGPGMPRLRPA